MYTFTINIFGKYLVSAKRFDSEKAAEKALQSYLELSWGNFPGTKINGYIHLA